VTLEPCSHQGRTPPCAAALLRARVARVVYTIEDPNPEVSGRGAALLREAGVTVESGLGAGAARELNCGFLKRMQYGRPWVRLKLAMSLDGRTALASGASRWITGEAARADVQRWRSRSTAILTGIGTVLADDPRLDVRAAEEAPPRQPLRVLLDRGLRTPPSARLFSSGGEVLILTEQAALADAERGAALSAYARIESVPAAGARLALGAVLDRLGELEVNELLVEAGPTLSGELVRESLADELLLYVAPKLLGEQGLPLVHLPQLSEMSEARGFELIDTQRVGDDLRLRLRPRAPAH
jgi:diaminohydroxyphosphoribosylaminopyrimidine deaminase/5-amino-6-(5-phosphoribosylamino)uracil reductase